MSPLLVNMIHLKSPFNRMKLRHDLWKKKYPDSKEKHGIPWRGIANASPELEALGNPRINEKDLPFDPLEYIEELDQLPFDPDMDPGLGKGATQKLSLKMAGYRLDRVQALIDGRVGVTLTNQAAMDSPA
jgi:hypothetical protein